MRLRLYSLTISNFKGVSGTHTVNFDSNMIFLTGPNGYGKTTIYDAIELCLTGSILRIENAKGHENANKRHAGSILHNDPNQDININLELSKDNEKRTIYMVCPKAESKQQFIDWDKFKCSFIDSDGNSSGDRSVIGKWLEITQGSYRLFTYLQQSDSTFFLKLAQKERHMMLNPLLDTSGRYNDELTSIDTFRKRLTGYNNHLASKLKSFDNNSIREAEKEVSYTRLFKSGDIQHFDMKDPFKDLEIEAAKAEYNKINSQLDVIEQFFEQFTPSEYIKSEKRKYLDRFKNDKDFIKQLSLQEVIKNRTLLAESFERAKLRNSLDDATHAKKYLLSEFLDAETLKQYKDTAERRSGQSIALYDDDKNLLSLKQILLNIIEDDKSFSIGDRQKARIYLKEYEPIVKAAGIYGQLLNELQTAREELVKQFDKTIKHKDQRRNDCECPLCGKDWRTVKALSDSIGRKAAAIGDLVSDEGTKVRGLEAKIIDEFIKPIMQARDEMQSDAARYETIRRLGVLEQADTALNADIDKSLSGLKGLVSTNQLETEKEIESALSAVREYARKQIPDDEITVVGIIKSLQSKDYTNYFDILKRLKIAIPEDILCGGLNIPSPQELEKAQNAITDILIHFAEEIQVKPESSLPEHVRLYKDLLEANGTNFYNTKAKLSQKKKYIEQQFGLTYFKSKKEIELQQEKIQILLSRVNVLKSDYNEALRLYQNDVTKALQLPFYVYSAKILQNSPQCLGVFMFAQQDSGTIVFTPQRGATHDIYPQLSSGQLVVVSMAFYLAINTTFHHQSTSLMAIDDPIQDLDSLNVQSLTELLRREFVGEYQILMSTHDELDVNYMKYKFGTVIANNNILDIDVQQTFFKAKTSEVSE